MIAQLRGRVVHRGPTDGRDAFTVVLDVHGVGYVVVLPAGLADRLPGLGEDVVVHTSLQVREDSMTLYGFPFPEARDLFELLMTASGVGPKLALACLSAMAPDVLRSAVREGDVDALTVIPGIGKKSAQRLVLELKDRVGGDPAEVAGLDHGGRDGAPLTEVRLALLELGYTPVEAQRAVGRLDPDGEVGELLRTALRSLADAGRA